MRSYRGSFSYLKAYLLIMSLVGVGVANAQLVPTDEDIANAVEAELIYSDLVVYDRSRLSVEDGIVTLSGSVPSITAKESIEDVTATVRGVRSIVNRLDVAAPPLSQDELRGHILATLDDNAATDLYQLDVDATGDGIVTLSGQVDSWAEYELAETVVGSVSGVRAIDNRIEVVTTGYLRGAGEIESEVRERLHWDARVDDSLIAVLVRDGGRVTLSGTVGSLAEKRLATSLAHVAGVRSVDADHLDVEAWARDSDRRLGAERIVDDNDLADAVVKALTLDPRVASNAIDVTVVDGAISLRGTVGSVAASRAAAHVASNTYGARQVDNFLTIEPSMEADAEVLERMTSALAMLDAYRDHEIAVGFEAGQATIAGDVDDAEQYRRIDSAVANTRGIESVVNIMTIRGREPVVSVNPYMGTTRLLMPRGAISERIASDRALHSAVQSELYWSPFVDESAIEIDVDDGAVTLTGTVASMNESMSASENAFEAGALTVRNRLEVE